jgi:phenylalanyl-tRNA synthetase alpha chain
MSDLVQQLEALKQLAPAEIAAAQDAAAVEFLRLKYLGKSGVVTSALEQIGSLPKDQKPVVGKLANELKHLLSAALRQKQAQLEQSQLAEQLKAVDLTLPGRRRPLGKLHPLTQVTNEVVGIFRRMGFAVEDGPDIETEWFNFEALNTPAHHPARDLQQTFYVDLPPDPHPRGGRRVLRTHTSPVQIRAMLKQKPPVRLVCPGRVYRRDNADATHSATFHQIEGLYVDRDVSVADLKGTVEFFFSQLLGSHIRTRFRPHYFPYTEPSFEIDLGWASPSGGGRQWLEIAGCGLVHPKVFEAVGYDPNEVTGWAFGMGIERLTMILYGINDIRLFYENDTRLLRQF